MKIRRTIAIVMAIVLCAAFMGCTPAKEPEDRKEDSSEMKTESSQAVESSRPEPEPQPEPELMIWPTDEMPVRLHYDRYWEYGDYADTEDPQLIEALVEAVKGLTVGEKTDMQVDDYTDILTFYFADEGMIRLEFEEQNWVVGGERYHVDGLREVRYLLNDWMESRYVVEDSAPDEKEPSKKQIFVADDDHVIIFELNDSPAALSLYNQLPIEVEVENYSTNEKIFYPPEALDTSDGIEGGGEAGILAYFEPWGNVVMYYGPFSEYPGLFILGEAIDFGEEIEELSGTVFIGVVQ